MKTVWKFPFTLQDNVTIRMPAQARILHAEVQGETPCLWALVDPGGPADIRHFRIIGTGHPIPDVDMEQLSFVTTFQQAPFVWHLFEVRNGA